MKPGSHCLPVVGHLEDIRDIKHRFASNQTLHFALGNVLREVLEQLNPSAVHVIYDAKSSLLLFSYRPGLGSNIYDDAAACLKEVQRTLERVLRIRMSFLIGRGCADPESLKAGLNGLLASRQQRFYLEPQEISKLNGALEQNSLHGDPDLFIYYDRASSELRESLLGKEGSGAVRDTVDRWIAWIQGKRYAPESVKDWVLKLLLDLKLRLHLLHSLSPAYTADALHKEIMDMDSLNELKSWLHDYLESTMQAMDRGFGAAEDRKWRRPANTCPFGLTRGSRWMKLRAVCT